ncbi:PaaI family thioesterase [Rhodopseudomonas boonkerdii]|uniref:PaaI family thioesterase n=1 Tax=Rhodopseudomonas boonkerdii TaxID=475937 RepID=UPI001E551F0C|nr:PaaI family thioesterase [Rhodopseudomonas boonkerdii]UGV27885.1 PaaI family thioesterase [Rhodopseudomonas boonkerdii]
MTDTVPNGFAPHFRKSPLTTPWEPIYSKITDKAVILGLRIADAHTNSRGMAHGGLITALADNAMGLSCGHVAGGGTRLVTVNLSTDFLGPAEIGQWLEIVTDVVKTGSRLCFAQALITADGIPCARANGTFSVAVRKD